MVARTEIIRLSSAASERSEGSVFLLEYCATNAVRQSAVKSAEVRRTYAVNSRRATKRTSSSVSIYTQEFLLIFIAAKDADITVARSCVDTHQERHQTRFTRSHATRIGNAVTLKNVGHETVVVRIFVGTILVVQLETLKVPLGNKVYNSSNRVRAIYRRSAGSNDIDALYKPSWN